MSTAGTAGSISPAAAKKPAEFRCRLSQNETSGRIPKTPNFEGYTSRVKKGMLCTGDYGIADPAAQNILSFSLHPVACFRMKAAFFATRQSDKQ